MKTFQPKLLTTFKNYDKKQLLSDIIAGVIVAIIALPLSIALAIASGANPEQGLYTAIFAGFIISALGGSKVNISGPTAAFATIVAGIIATEGMDGLAIATILAGVILILMGVLRLGALIKYVPSSITVGFTSGIALTIVIGQIKDFLGLTYPAGTNAIESIEKLKAVFGNLSTFNWQAFLVGAVALAILIVWPKISKKIPGSLVVVILGALVVNLCSLNVNTIGDLYTISSSFPLPKFAGWSIERIIHLIPNAFTIAILAAVESLLSCVVSDGMINDKHNSNTELIAQGMGNICAGVFGGIPATGAIARTAANVKNGGRSPVSGMVHAIVLLLVLLVLMPYASWIPMPVIAAILIMVAYNMCEWRKFVKTCKTAPISDIIVLVCTFVLTVVFDLVVAIAVGLVLACVLMLKKNTDSAKVEKWSDEKKAENGVDQGVMVYAVEGAMFFSASDKYDFAIEGASTVALVMDRVPFIDSTAVEKIEKLGKDCEKAETRLVIVGAASQPQKIITKCAVKAEFYQNIADVSPKTSETEEK